MMKRGSEPWMDVNLRIQSKGNEPEGEIASIQNFLFCVHQRPFGSVLDWLFAHLRCASIAVRYAF
jgi:hypothetical protein